MRLNPLKAPPGDRKFQSTHSLRSATAAKWAFNLVPIVSIHALLAECDMRDLAAAVDGGNVSIHALLAECDISFPYVSNN